ncbi:hypothetical protein A8F94_14855 [Bacillus sp. FJAT-27225]|uniref:DUF3139 domain-containing protein n=1 Tax=Bacillus sp. FJAT-27225 TaxID=1743144 RepID=UPI00080C2FD3|nr:DUF3139 domain-containing protein [Bacillus sp. FJAT-27225]OCA84013.1 hypothetical protein A8F94_14855 [Bacillus sp. FJAT-27225]
MSKNIKTARILIILGVLFAANLIYMFPVQKIWAEKEVESYMKEQGISQFNIKSKEFKKDYKQSGYIAEVELKDESGIIYEYYWRPGKDILLIGFKSGRSVEYSEMKYPPIPE